MNSVSCCLTNRSSAAVIDKVPALVTCTWRAQLKRWAS